MIPATPHAIMAHYFAPPAAQGALSADDFRRLLDVYGDRLRHAAGWINLALRGHLTNEVCITFDDGLREALDVALPVLEERHLTAAWYVPTQPLVGVPLSLETYRWARNHRFGGVAGFYVAWRLAMHTWAKQKTRRAWWRLEKLAAAYLPDRSYLTQEDREYRLWRDRYVSAAEYAEVMTRLTGVSLSLDHWLSASDLRALRAAGHVIGFHTHSHPTAIRHLTREQQATEYATSRWILEQILKEPVTTMAHPNGNVTDYGREWLKANGITLAWGSKMGGALPYEAPRWSTGLWA